MAEVIFEPLLPSPGSLPLLTFLPGSGRKVPWREAVFGTSTFAKSGTIRKAQFLSLPAEIGRNLPIYDTSVKKPRATQI